VAIDILSSFDSEFARFNIVNKKLIKRAFIEVL
jgi:hypothetical protein